MRLFCGMVALALMAAPVSANLLSPTDATFEDPWPDAAPNWYSEKQAGIIERDSTIHNPGPHSGSHWGSLQTGGNQGHAAWITVDGSGPLSLDLWVSGGQASGATSTLFVQLLDGDENGTVLGEWSKNMAENEAFAWTALSSLNGSPLAGVASSGQVTVKIGYRNLAGWSNGTAIHIDDVNLTPEPASLALMSLVGLPLLRRRRRS